MSAVEIATEERRGTRDGGSGRLSESALSSPHAEPLYLFAAATLAIQAWEMSLAILCDAVERGAPNRRRLRARHSGVALGPSAEHRSPADLVGMLGSSFYDQDLVAELTELTELQELMAHRYLRLQFLTAGTVRGPDSASFTELVTIAMRFIKSERRLRDTYGDCPARKQAELIADEVHRIFQPIARIVVDRRSPLTR